MHFPTSADQDKDQEGLLTMSMTPLIGIILVLMMVMIAGVAPRREVVLLDMENRFPKNVTCEGFVAGITIDIDFDDTLWWNDTPVSREELQRHLASAAQEQTPIHLRPSHMASHAAVAAMTNSIRKAGIQTISLAAVDLSGQSIH
ncbi:ExbD/TolR family protein [Undibacterium sp. Di27W]|uniref:ExbD/TolR family protein n=1 Tax=Undibacterium sp. Di27W TaxID=3413036 RepID=UPI003BF0FDDE